MQFQPIGIGSAKYASLVQLHGPGNGAAGAGRVQTKIVKNVVKANNVFRPVYPEVRAKLADGDVFRAITVRPALIAGVSRCLVGCLW